MKTPHEYCSWECTEGQNRPLSKERFCLLKQRQAKECKSFSPSLFGSFFPSAGLHQKGLGFVLLCTVSSWLPLLGVTGYCIQCGHYIHAALGGVAFPSDSSPLSGILGYWAGKEGCHMMPLQGSDGDKHPCSQQRLGKTAQAVPVSAQGQAL